MPSAGVEISPDGTRLVEKDNPFRWLDRGRTKAAYQGQFLVVWDLPQRRRLATLPIGPSGFYLGDNDNDIAFSPDGRLLAYARNDATRAAGDDLDRVALWDVRGQRELDSFDAQGVQSLAFDPPGDVLAVGFEDRIELRATGDHTLLQTITSSGTAASLAFSPDGSLLATSGGRGAFLWDVADRASVPTQVGTLVDREDATSGGIDFDVDFSPDGRYVAVADDGPEVILWDRDVRSWSRTLCGMLDRDFTGQERRRFFPGGHAPPTCEG